MAWRVVRYQEVSINDTRGRKTTSSTGRRSLAVPMVLCCTQWRFQGGGGPGGGGRGDHPPPLVAENVVCSNSNFSPTGAITPDHPPPLWPSPPPPFRKSCIRACVPYRNVPRLWEIRGPYDTLFYYVVNVRINRVSIIYESLEGTSNFLLLTSN